ncbi:hypothetical protein Avbf_01003 [Armadillidium vulgare]|nr:hypothetical protein Avbf_01003 [Armadillidium vulgare]
MYIHFKIENQFLSQQKLNFALLEKCFHTHTFSRNLELVTVNKLSKVKGLQVTDDNVSKEPLTLMYSWMLAKDQHVMKYSKLYLDKGINVLKIKISLFDLLLPTRGTQIVAGQVLDFLHLNPHFGPLLVHGFSVGAYVFSESMVKVSDDMDYHGPILKRFVGQIWDSGADIYQIPRGIPKSVSNNKLLQNSMEKYLRWYLNFNYDTATCHYERASEAMHANVLNAPGLVIFSKTDPISDYSVNMSVIRDWEKNTNVAIFTKAFENSSHVGHFQKYRKEYEAEVLAFLEKSRNVAIC